MPAFVTGAAGFIGSNLVDRLLHQGQDVIGFDNLSTGNLSNLNSALNHNSFRFVEGDLLDTNLLASVLPPCSDIYHLAANADVRNGLSNTYKDLEQNTIVTYHVLEQAVKSNALSFNFSSTGSVYGEADVFPTPENCAFPIQTSLYGASKLACEGMISAYAEGFGLNSNIFRFVSILGPRYSHGHVFDFYHKLLRDPSSITVLGNGRQRKSYLHVDDCISAVLLVNSQCKSGLNIFNLGLPDYCEVLDSLGWITEELSLSPKILLTGGDRGWVGDNPFILLDTQRISSLGWKPNYSIREGVLSTIRYLIAQ